MILPIIQEGDPILRLNSVPISLEVVGTPDFRQMTGAMVDTMRHHNALGLSAPQIGMPLRLCVISGRTGSPWSIFINPEIILVGGPAAILPEACLSIGHGNLNYAVERRTMIGIKFFDKDGAAQQFRTSKMLARVLQHELDHLDGKLISDIGTLIKPDQATVSDVGHA